jgi:hypothetical protein
MRNAAMLVLVTSSLANVLRSISKIPIDAGRAHPETLEVTNRFDHGRLCQSGGLEVERAWWLALAIVHHRAVHRAHAGR